MSTTNMGMNNELVLSIEVEDNGSLKVNNFSRTIEDTGRSTEETAGKFNKLNTVLDRVGKGLFSQKKAVSGLAEAFDALKLQTDKQLSSFGAGSLGLGSLSLDSLSLGSLSLGSLSLDSLAGPLTVVAEGVMTALIAGVRESEPKIPSFDLLWETIDGQIANVTESWKNMAPDQKVVAAAQDFVQSQLDFFQKLTAMTGGGEIPSFNFSLGGIGESIKDVLRQQTTEGLIKTALGASGRLSEVFGPEFMGQLKDIFMQTLSPNLGMFTFGQNQQIFQDYMNWKFGQFMTMPSEEAMKSFESWMNSSSIFSPVGRPGIAMNSILDLFQHFYPNVSLNQDTFGQLEQFAAQAQPSAFNRGEIALGAKTEKPWQDFFTNLKQQITDIFDLITKGMGEAFSASLQTGEFQTFEDKFKQSILSSVQQGLIKGFAEQELLPVIFKPFYGTDNRPAFTEILKQYQTGDLSLGQAQGYLSQMLGEFSSTLAGFEPVWELLNQTNQSLLEAINLNTTAIGSNTDAIMGPVNAFLMSLESSSLAPSLSLAGLSGLKEQLYAGALSDPSQFKDYANFMTSQYLPWLQEVSSNYGTEISGIRAEVENIPWVRQAKSAQDAVADTTAASAQAQDIGRQVSRALAPMLLKESQQITINVVVDGQVIKQKVIDSLDDPAVTQKMRIRI